MKSVEQKLFDFEQVRLFDGQGNPVNLEEMIGTIKHRLPTDLRGKIFVGTDGHVHGNKYAFVTAICLWGEGTGGHFYKFRTFVPRSSFPSLHNRLLAESQRSIDVTLALMERESSFTADKFTLHLDVNLPKSPHKSGQSAESFKSYVKAYGFDCEIKPASWAANAVADKFAR